MKERSVPQLHPVLGNLLSYDNYPLTWPVGRTSQGLICQEQTSFMPDWAITHAVTCLPGLTLLLWPYLVITSFLLSALQPHWLASSSWTHARLPTSRKWHFSFDTFPVTLLPDQGDINSFMYFPQQTSTLLHRYIDHVASVYLPTPFLTWSNPYILSVRAHPSKLLTEWLEYQLWW